ncbi:uncharacterized protein LOC114239664 [Bombyx mandarina]|uniref:Uncharacterized protein LOC114239664 n=1 Tax=Bombyx mandarina TaxID=7092 RepID=A0A6J2JB69_BOMMA|nr:uncharacterized protein LOC114239664 [Bombyx mandarina]
MFSRLVVLGFVICVANAATWIGRLPKKPEHLAHKEGCYVKEIDDVIAFGKTVTPIGHCYEISCGKRMMDYSSCGTIDSSDESKCFITDIDLSKPFPDCCPQFKCDIENNID